MKKLLFIICLVLSFIAGYYFCQLKFIKYIKLETALQEIKKHKYSNDYNCQNFTSDLRTELKKYGIQSNEVIVNQGENYHSVVGIWFDGQTGTYAKNYSFVETIE